MIPFKKKSLLKIVVVEDSAVVMKRLVVFLNETTGLSVVGHASNMVSALRVIRDKKPDAVILDIYLKDDAPDFNGIDLLVRLRSLYPSLLIIMLSNMATSKYTIKCLELGANYFLDKTSDFHKIPDALKTHFNIG